MIPRSPTAQALAREANRNVLKLLDKFLEEWDKRLEELAPEPAQPRSRARVTAKKK